MVSVVIPKMLLVATFAATRQLARSLDASLHANWDDFVDFFCGRDLSLYASLLDQLGELHCRGEGHAGSGEVPPELPWFRVAFARCKFLLFGTARLSPDSLQFILSSIKKSFLLIDGKSKPADSKIIDLRMRLSACEFIIQQRAMKSSLKMAQDVEHFNASRYREHFPLATFFKSRSD